MSLSRTRKVHLLHSILEHGTHGVRNYDRHPAALHRREQPKARCANAARAQSKLGCEQ